MDNIAETFNDYKQLFPTINGSTTIRYSNGGIFIYNKKLKKTLNGNTALANFIRHCVGVNNLEEILEKLSREYKKENLKSEIIKIVSSLCREDIIELKDTPSNVNLRICSQEFLYPVDTVYLELTKKCNLRCVHCYASSPTFSKLKNQINELKLSDWKKTIDKLEEMGVINICFTGGEPFLHNDFADILNYVNLKGFEIGIFTNGTLIDEKYYSILKTVNPKFIAISLYSHIPELYRQITGVDQYQKVIQILRKLKNINLPVSINCILFNEINNSYTHITGFIESLINMGFNPEQITFDEFCPEGEGELKKHLRINEVETNSILCKAFKDVCNINYKQNPIDNTHKSIISFCGIGVDMFYLTSQGQIALCPVLSGEKNISGNILTDDIKDVWNNSELFNFFREQKYLNNSPCKECDSLPICQAGCRAKSITFFNSIHQIDPWMCAFFNKSYRNTIQEKKSNCS